MTAKVNLSLCTEEQTVSEEEITLVTVLSSKNTSMYSPNAIDNILYGIVYAYIINPCLVKDVVFFLK